MGACTHDPRRGVNKCVHREIVDARSRKMDCGRENLNECVYVALQVRTQTIGNNVDRGRQCNMERAVFLKCTSSRS
jgi:hypothetical protein